MVTAQEIIKTEILKRDANETLSQAINLFNDTDAIIITDHDKYQGMVLKHTLIEPTLTLQTKLHNMLSHTPKITQTTTVEEIACAMVQNNVYYLPVLDYDTILGIVTADDVIKKLTQQNIGTQPVKTIMCTKPISLGPNETIGKALHLFRQEKISYLPIIDHNTVVGAITIHTIINKVLNAHSNVEGRNDFESEKRQKLNFPVKTIMHEQPLLLSPETTIRNVHNRMHELELPGVLIGKENHLHGIVTHKELLAPFAGLKKEETIAIQFHHRNEKVKGFDKEQTVQFLREEFLKNYEKYIDVGYLHISLEQHKETKQGLFRVVCEMKLSGKPGVFYATQEGYGPMQAMKNAFLAIEHQINKVKKT